MPEMSEVTEVSEAGRGDYTPAGGQLTPITQQSVPVNWNLQEHFLCATLLLHFANFAVSP
jgi:hypothetical protein